MDSASSDGNAVGYFVDRHAGTGRGGVVAFQDPSRSLTYDGLADATRRFAGAVREAGVARERRVALLMLDTVDFPIAFWGAIRAGVVPVPINTLLTHETVGYILADSRADALVISAPLAGPLLPVLRSVAELRRIIVAQPDGGTPAPIDDARAVGFADFLAGGDPATPTAVTPADEVAFWLYSSGSTGAPKGVRHVHGSLRATADTYGAPGAGDPAGRSDVLRGEGVPCLWAWQFDDVSDVGRRRRRAVAGPADAGCGARHHAAPSADDVRRRADAVRVDAGQSAHRSGRRIGAAAALHLGRRGTARPISARRWRDMVGVDILDGIGSTEMLHIFVSNRAGRRPLRHVGQAGAGLRRDDPGRARRPRCRMARRANWWCAARRAAEGYWNQRDKTRRTFRGEWTHTGDTYIRDADGYYRFCGRTDEMLKVSGVWVSPFEVEEALVSHPAVLESAVVGASGSRRTDQAQGVRRVAGCGARTGRRDSEGAAEDACEGADRRVEISALDRVRRGLPKTATGKIQRFRLRDQR